MSRESRDVKKLNVQEANMIPIWMMEKAKRISVFNGGIWLDLLRLRLSVSKQSVTIELNGSGDDGGGAAPVEKS